MTAKELYKEATGNEPCKHIIAPLQWYGETAEYIRWLEAKIETMQASKPAEFDVYTDGGGKIKIAAKTREEAETIAERDGHRVYKYLRQSPQDILEHE